MTNKEINEYAFFKKGLRLINEAGINRILSHGKYGFIIISANRSEISSSNPHNDLTGKYEQWCNENKIDNPSDFEVMKQWLSQRNKQAEADLKDELKKSPFAYTPVFGGYHGSDDVTDSFEPSYIVYCHGKHYATDYYPFEKLFKFALHLCNEYQQDSVYIQAPDEAPIWVNGEGAKINKTSTKNFKINDFSQTYYTTVNRSKRDTKEMGLDTKPQRFTADIQFESKMYTVPGPSTYFDRMKRETLGEVFLNN